MVDNNAGFLPPMMGGSPPEDVNTHIVDIDLVHTGDEVFYVLEGNARTSSDVSYMPENRETMLQYVSRVVLA